MKVIVGLSGGVDSSVAVINLLKQGYEVEAMFMRNWDSATNNDIMGNPTLNDDVCPQEVDYQDALKVANALGVKLHRIDFINEYWDYEKNEPDDLLNCPDINEIYKQLDEYHLYIQYVDAGCYVILAKAIEIDG